MPRMCKNVGPPTLTTGQRTPEEIRTELAELERAKLALTELLTQCTPTGTATGSGEPLRSVTASVEPTSPVVRPHTFFLTLRLLYGNCRRNMVASSCLELTVDVVRLFNAEHGPEPLSSQAQHVQPRLPLAPRSNVLNATPRGMGDETEDLADDSPLSKRKSLFQVFGFQDDAQGFADFRVFPFQLSF